MNSNIDITGKIDYVITYVDPTDLAWQNLYKISAKKNKQTNTENTLRYSENVLFKFVFRGIEKYMPWINNVILVVSSESQVPVWVNRNEVKVVTHDQFIPTEFLPTFNSCTIECFLHRIPGLSPFFIYGNDDTYVMNHCTISDFFEGVMPRSKLMQIRYSSAYATQHNKLCQHMFDLCTDKLNMKREMNNYYVPFHIQQAFSKSIFENIFSEFQDDIYKSIKPFRQSNCISQYLFSIYYNLTVGTEYKSRLQNSRYDMITELAQIRRLFNAKVFPKVICLNNNNPKTDIAFVHKFKQKFPAVSKYEVI